jgi:hypothetical protein
MASKILPTKPAMAEKILSMQPAMAEPIKPFGAAEAMKKRLKGEERLSNFEKLIGFAIPKEFRENALNKISDFGGSPDQYNPYQLYNFLIGEKEWNAEKGKEIFERDKAIYTSGVDPSKTSDKVFQNYIKNESNPKIKDKSEKVLLKMPY